MSAALWLLFAAQLDQFNVELSQGPIIAPARIVGMGGAYVSISEGAGAIQFNPSAVALRMPHNAGELWDLDWSLDFNLVGIGPKNVDFDNSGRVAQKYDPVTLAAGLNVVVERFGFGGWITFQQAKSNGFRYHGRTAALALGYNFLDGQFVAGAEIAWVNTSVIRGADNLLDMGGLGGRFGGLFRPSGEPYRFGLSFRPRLSVKADATPEAESLMLPVPQNQVVPWELVAGASYSFGSRAHNATPTFGDKPNEPEAKDRARDYVTLAADLVLTGSSPSAIAFGSWASSTGERAGGDWTLGVRLGAESELVPDLFRARGGAYFEPSRIEGRFGRVHATTGFDVHLRAVLMVNRS